MDEYDDDLDQGVEESAEEVTSGTEDKALEKLRKENHSLRTRLRRSELETEFGSKVAELVPDALPLSEWKEYAAKLAAFQGPAVSKADQTEATEEAPEVEPTEAEKRLATVGKVSPPGAALPEELLTVGQIKELAKSDPAEAERLIMEGKFQQQVNW